MPAPGTSGKMPVSRNTVTGVLRVIARMRASSVSGMTASSEAAKASIPNSSAISYTSQPTAPASPQ